ncbi:ABC transporter [Gloeomargarita lithophora Alchichica-D10]|uniref:ABC transporter n=1 Tax=Gloeomargarita lithophora Alchichica-D10 TaxID=1188229 RepID=A0A1J0ACJ8_9CYAN|nr:ABC transporter ATP-binding protein [Gloeomargarita lithophora]APB33643.1 ABC transporter [Gloeomargarita lithophora Alchichica-D10]
MPPLLNVQNLEVRFPGHTPVRGVSFRLAPGQVLGIVGESGSGKSLTALALMGLVPAPGIVQAECLAWSPPQQPAVDLGTLTPQSWPRYRGRAMGMVFQEPASSLNPVYPCGWQLAEACRAHQPLTPAQVRQRQVQLLQEVQLLPPDAPGAMVQSLFNRYPHQFSGGQLQRWMLAIALASDPWLLLADEPTTALDVTIQAEILTLLKRLCQHRQMATILISHDLAVVGDLAGHVLVMYQGTVVESGDKSAIFHQPQHPYTRGLLVCRPTARHRLPALPTLADFLENRPLPPPIPAAVTAQRLSHLQHQPVLLQVQDLRVAYRRQGQASLAVNGVSFAIHRGETLGLVGESGCGKSTLARAVLRLLPPHSGRIFFDGQDITHRSAAQLRPLRRRMQLIFQDPLGSLSPRMTVREALLEPLRIHSPRQSHRLALAQVVTLLERVGLDAAALPRYPHQFSGGQRQRLAIARALVTSPDFIICDESVSALDISIQAQVLNLLKQLQTEFQLTYLFISHDLSVVHFMSDRIMVMNQGQILEIGSADQIYHHPQHPYTQSLIQAIPHLDIPLVS